MAFSPRIPQACQVLPEVGEYLPFLPQEPHPQRSNSPHTSGQAQRNASPQQREHHGNLEPSCSRLTPHQQPLLESRSLGTSPWTRQKAEPSTAQVGVRARGR